MFEENQSGMNCKKMNSGVAHTQTNWLRLVQTTKMENGKPDRLVNTQIQKSLLALKHSHGKHETNCQPTGINLQVQPSYCRLKLPKEPDVVFEEQSQVFNLIGKHSDALNAHTESISGIHITVYSAIFQNIGVNHSAAHNFDPSGVFANIAAFLPANTARHIHFGRWLGEWKERRSQANPCALTKHFASEVEQGLLHISK